MSAGVVVTEVSVAQVLTRASGYLDPVSTHSLQPYRGCTYGRSLCGVGCYVRANPWVTQGREWGGFLEVRTDAAASYLRGAPRERRWARGRGRDFSIFMSSSTDPFVPQERRHRVTAQVLEAMLDEPPDELIVQTHSPLVLDALDALVALGAVARVRVHLTIESDRDRMPGLPAPAASVDRRFQAAARLREAGLFTVVTAAPLLPLADPEAFFARVARCADALVLDHFVGGDGSPGGARTRRTGLPAAMAEVDPASVDAAYLEGLLPLARAAMPGRVGVGAEGFAARYLPA